MQVSWGLLNILQEPETKEFKLTEREEKNVLNTVEILLRTEPFI